MAPLWFTAIISVLIYSCQITHGFMVPPFFNEPSPFFLTLQDAPKDAESKSFIGPLVLGSPKNPSSKTVFSGGRKNLPIGTNDFHAIVKSNYLFVDKTELIRDVMENNAEVILITRPRHFGKSFGLSMLYNFLASNASRPENNSLPSLYHSPSDLFRGLKISEHKNFCSNHKYQYPVIHVSFEDVDQKNYPDAEAKVISIIQNVYKQHAYLLDRNIFEPPDRTYFQRILNGTALLKDIKQSISTLCKHLHNVTRKKVILLFDAYDKPFQTAFFHDYDDQVKNLVGALLVTSLKETAFVKKAVITGSIVLTIDSLLADISNLKIFSVVQNTKYSCHFGFTEDEVDSLLKQTDQVTLKNELVKAYSGYNFSGTVVYNPYSVVKCLTDGKPGSYWKNEDFSGLIKELLRSTGMNVKGILVYLFQNRIADGMVIYDQVSLRDIKQDEESLWTLLVHAGYLNTVSMRKIEGISVHSLKIPTLEVKNALAELCNTVFDKDLSKLTKDFTSFEKSVKEGEVKELEKFVNTSLKESGNHYDFRIPNSNLVYHAYLLGLFAPLKKFYQIKSHRKSGYGKYDLALVPDLETCPECTGIIFDLQIAKDKGSIEDVARNASQKIDDKHYISIFQGRNYKRFLGVGVGFFQDCVSMHGYEFHLLKTAIKKENEGKTFAPPVG